MLNEVVADYLKLFPGDGAKLQTLLDQLRVNEELDDRRNFRGHIAGDALVLSPDLKKILLIYHKRSGRWQQPGGHWDKGEEGPWLTAEREAWEETGIEIDRRLNIDEQDQRIPLHIVTGPVYPVAAKNEPYHQHHDFRYAFVAKSEKLGIIQDPGVGGSKWVSINSEELHGGHELEISVERLKRLLADKG